MGEMTAIWDWYYRLRLEALQAQREEDAREAECYRAEWERENGLR